ncbi:hypothetical protein CCH79_00020017 [Gambusia affinis]|uniref:Zinc transporter ZIP3 n=1 Tax=Gambusia affinis TaxID=33528 RepID=A0A315W773_GAMAF|nr:hypothetical protein CCH79_00020017 [Gambusia affinis]
MAALKVTSLDPTLCAASWFPSVFYKLSVKIQSFSSHGCSSSSSDRLHAHCSSAPNLQKPHCPLYDSRLTEKGEGEGGKTCGKYRRVRESNPQQPCRGLKASKYWFYDNIVITFYLAAGVLQQLQVSSDYPLAETMMMVGFFITLFVEQTVLTFRKEKPSFIALETFNAGGSEAGSDSEYDAPFLGGGHRHGHFGRGQLGAAGPLRLAGLVLALSAHSLFEGVALGLQEDGAKLGGLLLGVAVHETLAAAALGVSLAKAALGMKDAAKLAAAVAMTIPLGAAAGMGVEAARTLAAGVASLLLQGLAAGTFLFVTFMEVLSPELEQRNDRLLKVLCLVLGYAALAALLLIRW